MELNDYHLTSPRGLIVGINVDSHEIHLDLVEVSVPQGSDLKSEALKATSAKVWSYDRSYQYITTIAVDDPHHVWCRASNLEDLWPSATPPAEEKLKFVVVGYAMGTDQIVVDAGNATNQEQAAVRAKAAIHKRIRMVKATNRMAASWNVKKDPDAFLDWDSLMGELQRNGVSPDMQGVFEYIHLGTIFHTPSWRMAIIDNHF